MVVGNAVAGEKLPAGWLGHVAEAVVNHPPQVERVVAGKRKIGDHSRIGDFAQGILAGWELPLIIRPFDHRRRLTPRHHRYNHRRTDPQSFKLHNDSIRTKIQHLFQPHVRPIMSAQRKLSILINIGQRAAISLNIRLSTSPCLQAVSEQVFPNGYCGPWACDDSRLPAGEHARWFTPTDANAASLI